VRLGLGGALAAGAAGALAVTLANELARRLVEDAPRLDLLGTRAVAKLASPGGLGRAVPGRRLRLRRAALAGDLASNALYYALAAPGRSPRPVARGLGLGVLAGLGAVVLAPRLGLGHRPTEATLGTALMTVGWYTFGGVVAGATARALRRDGDLSRIPPIATA
jgi:hypothetical protein